MMEKPKHTKLAIQLAKRIKEDLGIDVYPKITRLYPGNIQGGWLWSMHIIDSIHSVGSPYYSATSLVRAKKLNIARQEISIERDGE